MSRGQVHWTVADGVLASVETLENIHLQWKQAHHYCILVTPNLPFNLVTLSGGIDTALNVAVKSSQAMPVLVCIANWWLAQMAA